MTQFMRIPPGPPRKSSGVDSKTKHKLVIDALLKAREFATPPLLLLERAGPNWLGPLYRHEVISALKEILNADRELFDIIPREDFEGASDEAKTLLTGLAGGKTWWKDWVEAPEDAPIILGISNAFDNWCEAQRHKRSSTLKNLSEASRLKVLDVVATVYQQFELTSNPKVSIHWGPTDANKTHEARRLALEFLENKDVVTRYEFHYEGGGFIEVEIDVKEFFRIRDELLALYTPETHGDDTPPQEAPTLSPSKSFASIGDLKWEEVTIRFFDGHNVRISARDTTTTVDFKQMGFEDARNREPNTQWHLLSLLAKGGGRLGWEDSEASVNFKKKKQMLSDTLKAFFKIDDDPFLSYRNESAYVAKFKLKAEGD